MTLAQLRQAWDKFFFSEEPPVAMALYRIMFGLTMIQFCVLMAPTLLVWYGHKGIISAETAREFAKVPCVNFLSFLPAGDDTWLVAFFVVFCLASVLATFGLFTRFALFVAWLGFAAFHHRNLFNLNSGDVLMGLSSFYLFFSCAGEAFSLDRLLRVWMRPDADRNAPRLFSVWPQSLLKLQICAIYCQAFWSKMIGDPWLDGSALYWVLRQREFWRFQIPIVPNSLFLCQLMSWYTLVIEFAIWTLVWIRDLRYWVLAGIIVLHLGIDYAMNLPMFETLMIAGLIVFVYPEDLTKIMDFIKAHLNKGMKERPQLLFDGGSLFCTRVVETIHRLDILGRIEIIDAREAKIFRGKTSFRGQDGKEGLWTFTGEEWVGGGKALLPILRHLPLAWPCYPVFFLLPFASLVDWGLTKARA